MQKGKRQRSVFLDESSHFALLLKGDFTGKKAVSESCQVPWCPRKVSYLTPDQAQPGSNISKQVFYLILSDRRSKL